MGTPERPLLGQPWLHAPTTVRVLAALVPAGRPVRFVGGCVRDALAGRTAPRPDLDLASAIPPERAMDLLADAGIKVVPTGLAHGTITAVVAHQHFEITTLRRDVATDGRRATIAYTDDFLEDARRRDFTINAMSADPLGRLFDYFGGRADLAAGRVRFVGDPDTRIAEDHLRILRFFRFHAHYGRGEPEAAALAACARAASAIRRLSGERVRTELLKLLAARDPLPTLHAMEKAGVQAEVLGPALAHGRLARLLPIETVGDPILRLAALLRPPPADAATAPGLAERLRLSRREATRLSALIGRALPDPAASPAIHRRALHVDGAALYADLLRLAFAEAETPDAAALDRALALCRTWQPKRLPIGGADVAALGIPSGRAVGRLLRDVEAWWIEQDFGPDREACLERLRALVENERARVNG